MLMVNSVECTLNTHASTSSSRGRTYHLVPGCHVPRPQLPRDAQRPSPTEPEKRERPIPYGFSDPAVAHHPSLFPRASNRARGLPIELVHDATFSPSFSFGASNSRVS